MIASPKDSAFTKKTSRAPPGNRYWDTATAVAKRVAPLWRRTGPNAASWLKTSGQTAASPPITMRSCGESRGSSADGVVRRIAAGDEQGWPGHRPGRDHGI
jgi:hypothetical protein